MNTSAKKTLALAISTSLLAFGLVGCGGGSGGDSSSDNGKVESSFTKSATWTVDGTKVGDTCYDFDAQAAIDCMDDKWDIKFSNEGRSVNLWTNSGISGPGKGAAFYLMPLKDILAVNNAMDVPPVGFKIDQGAGIFTQKPWSAYNLNDKHKLSPNNRVYLVTTDATDANIKSTASKPVYAMQIINYYDQAGVPGHPTIRWIDTALPSQVRTQTIDASSNEKWVYVNLKNGEITDKAGDWHVGFNRYNVILNNGISGDGQVGGYLAKTPAGYYDAKGHPIKDKFIKDNTQESLADLTEVNNYDISSDEVPWVIDAASSQLNPKPTGQYPTIDYGWYVYKGDQGHRLFAKPKDEAIGALIRSAEGNSYARLYLEEIKYADPNKPAPTEWVYKLDIQPASK